MFNSSIKHGTLDLAQLIEPAHDLLELEAPFGVDEIRQAIK
jgi:hypothetical protein